MNWKERRFDFVLNYHCDRRPAFAAAETGGSSRRPSGSCLHDSRIDLFDDIGDVVCILLRELGIDGNGCEEMQNVDDGPGLRHDEVFNIVRTDVKALVNFLKPWQCSRQDDGGVEGMPGLHRKNHFIVRAKPQRRHGALQRRRNGSATQDVAAAHPPAERFFKPGALYERIGSASVPAE